MSIEQSIKSRQAALQLGKRTLREIVVKTIENGNDRSALGFIDGEQISYAQFGQKIRRIHLWLDKLGVEKGDRIAILGENMPNWGLIYFAVTSMGAVAVPILPDFHSNEIMHIVKHSEARILFASDRLFAKVELGNNGILRHVFSLDCFELLWTAESDSITQKIREEGNRRWHNFKQAALQWAGMEDRVDEDDLACIIYTSGTTGHSKGVMLSHSNIVSDALSTLTIVDVTPEDRFLSILPLSHTYECTLGLVTPLMCGASVSYLDRPPTPSILLPALKKVRPTIMLSVPLIMEKIFKTRIYPKLTGKKLMKKAYQVPFIRKKLHKAAGSKLMDTFGGQVRAFCIGGASMAPEVERFMYEAGFPYAIGYGLTETSPLIAGTGPDETRLRSTGKALAGTRIRIDADDKNHGEGEIQVKGPTVMKGYYKDPERTNEVFTDDGWLRTGDLGVFDKDDYLYIKGRSKNVIIGPSGENIYPEEIESVVNNQDFVLESLVFEKEGKLVARIHLDYEAVDEACDGKPQAEIMEDIQRIMQNIKREVNGQVSRFSRLSEVIEQTEPFEKTPTQKIKRYLYV